MPARLLAMSEASRPFSRVCRLRSCTSCWCAPIRKLSRIPSSAGNSLDSLSLSSPSAASSSGTPSAASCACAGACACALSPSVRASTASSALGCSLEARALHGCEGRERLPPSARESRCTSVSVGSGAPPPSATPSMYGVRESPRFATSYAKRAISISWSNDAMRSLKSVRTPRRLSAHLAELALNLTHSRMRKPTVRYCCSSRE
mmetsp:Transcript_5928/g.13010  ORF Transcript_5928/g.13010 Transcript_5928/m.13010 type:complete len:205 (+) Transcript_5928:928-1542(+)